MPTKQKFQAKLLARGPKGAWTHIVAPFDALSVFGTRARVPVRGTINGFPFRTSIMPEGGGTHYMAVTHAMQKGAQAAAGDIVQVVMEVDAEERPVEAPTDLKAVLAKSKEASEVFTALAYSHRKEFVHWIDEAKKPATRARRIEKTIEMLLNKQRAKS